MKRNYIAGQGEKKRHGKCIFVRLAPLELKAHNKYGTQQNAAIYKDSELLPHKVCYFHLDRLSYKPWP